MMKDYGDILALTKQYKQIMYALIVIKLLEYIQTIDIKKEEILHIGYYMMTIYHNKIKI